MQVRRTGTTGCRVIHKENTGVSDTRNQALELAEGVYIQFLDSDDWIVPEATRLLVQAMEKIWLRHGDLGFLPRGGGAARPGRATLRRARVLNAAGICGLVHDRKPG